MHIWVAIQNTLYRLEIKPFSDHTDIHEHMRQLRYHIEMPLYRIRQSGMTGWPFEGIVYDIAL